MMPTMTKQQVSLEAREAILAELRGRKLLRYLFEEDPSNVGAYGYLSEPLDVEIQNEIADALVVAVEALICSMVIDEAAGEGWQPRIGEQVEVTEDVDDWRGWRELKLFVAGVGAHRLGLPGLEITVSEDWPRSSESSGLTDDFWINRPFKPDMLRPVSASSIRQLGESGRP